MYYSPYSGFCYLIILSRIANYPSTSFNLVFAFRRRFVICVLFRYLPLSLPYIKAGRQFKDRYKGKESRKPLLPHIPWHEKPEKSDQLISSFALYHSFYVCLSHVKIFHSCSRMLTLSLAIQSVEQSRFDPQAGDALGELTKEHHLQLGKRNPSSQFHSIVKSQKRIRTGTL